MSEKTKNLLVDCVTFAIGYGIAYLMTHPDARQLLVMRVTALGRRYCQNRADFWQDAAARFATSYNKARL